MKLWNPSHNLKLFNTQLKRVKLGSGRMIQSCKLATQARVKKYFFQAIFFLHPVMHCLSFVFYSFQWTFSHWKTIKCARFSEEKEQIFSWRQCKKRRAILETMGPRLADKDRVFGTGQSVLLWLTWLVILRCFASVWSWRAWIASICARSFKTNKHNIYGTVRYKVKEKSHTLISERIARKGKHTPLCNLDLKLNVKIP